jgi:hypothetical protein
MLWGLVSCPAPLSEVGHPVGQQAHREVTTLVPLELAPALSDLSSLGPVPVPGELTAPPKS